MNAVVSAIAPYKPKRGSKFVCSRCKDVSPHNYYFLRDIGSALKCVRCGTLYQSPKGEDGLIKHKKIEGSAD